jgi:acyl-CoA thioesterase-1
VRVARFDVVAKTGWRTDELLHGIAEAQLANQYDIITIQIGVNNQFQNKSINKYQKELKVLFEFVKTKRSKQAKVFVLSIPNYGFTPAGQRFNQEKISAELDEYNAFAKQLAAKYNYQFVNITPISENGIADPTLVAKDGLHPSGKQYKLWVTEVMKLLQIKNPDQIGQDYKQ